MFVLLFALVGLVMTEAPGEAECKEFCQNMVQEGDMWESGRTACCAWGGPPFIWLACPPGLQMSCREFVKTWLGEGYCLPHGEDVDEGYTCKWTDISYIDSALIGCGDDGGCIWSGPIVERRTEICTTCPDDE